MGDYQSWLEQHIKVLAKVTALIEKYSFKVVIIEEERKPPFLRIIFGSKKVDFQVKAIKTNFARSVWLCKEERFKIDNFYILYSKKESKFFIASGHDIDKEFELKESEWNKDVKYMVVPFSTFRPAITFFKRMKLRYEAEAQTRLGDY